MAKMTNLALFGLLLVPVLDNDLDSRVSELGFEGYAQNPVEWYR